MSPIDKTKEIVSMIEKLEENKYRDYNLDLNIDVLTRLEYYKKNLKNLDFNFSLDSLQQAYRVFLEGKMAGLAHVGTDKMFILARDYNLMMAVNHPIKTMTDHFQWQEAITAHTTFHEIRHILQGKGIDVSHYDNFCSILLSDPKGNKAFTDKNFHDNLYNEIDANLYGARQCISFFKDNKQLQDYFYKLEGIHTIQKNSFDFDGVFEKWQQEVETNGFVEESYNSQMFHLLWNQSGKFKTPNEIQFDIDYMRISNSNDRDAIGLNTLCTRIISSDAYLSRLNINSLTSGELNFIEEQINKNNELLEHQKGVCRELFHDKMVDEKMSINAMKLVDDIINKKEEFKLQLNDRRQEIIKQSNIINKGGVNLEYTFDELKELYDNYEIVFDSDKQPSSIIDKRSGAREYGEKLEVLKMAYVWTSAVAQSLDKTGQYINENRKLAEPLTDYEYTRAFDDDAKEIFNNIMKNELMQYENTNFDHFRHGIMFTNDDLTNNTRAIMISTDARKEIFENYLKNASQVKLYNDFELDGHVR